MTRRQIIRAMVKRVEIDDQSVRVVYRVAPPPSTIGPTGAFCNTVGGVISPLLANVYLHYVLDEWFHETVHDHMEGETFLIRYADDFVIGFTRESDVRRVMEVIPKRFAKFGLTIHPDKTRLIRFHRPKNQDDSRPTPDSFDLLGFTFHWRRSRKGTCRCPFYEAGSVKSKGIRSA